MKILISGGTGLVGSELGKQLAARGHELFILTRSKEKASLYCPFPQTPITWDELDSHPQVSELNAIVNLAGANLTEKRWNKKFKEKIYDSRIKGTKQLVELANNKCPQLESFVSTSAVGIYGEADDKPVEEDYSLSYDFLGKVCQDWEEPVKHLEKARGVILRVGIVFSEKGGALAEMVPPIQMGLSGSLTNGKFYQSWIDIDDLVNMYIFALENPIQGIFNATAPNPETNKNITQAIADQLGVKPGLPVPFFAIRLAVGEMAHHLVESQTISPQKIMNKGFHFAYKTASESITRRVAKLSGTEKRYIFEQWLPKTKDEVFPFFAEARNLEDITPPSLNFKIISVSDETLNTGTIIKYKLRIDGIPVRWTTLIKDWNPPHMFSDNQEKGPYNKWYHIHRFEDLAGGTLMTDQVDFKIPLGLMGYAAASWKVLKDVNKIFKYRREIIHRMYFNK